MKYILPLLYDYVLPNYVMPNALPPELGMINYLHTLNNNSIQNRNTFFEQSLYTGNDTKNVLTFLYGESFGTFPNSMGGYLNLCTEMYDDFLQVNEDSVFFGKRSNPKYIYPIKITPHIDDFAGFSRTGSKVNGEYFWKHISAQALEDIKNGNAIIFLDYAQENFVEIPSYERLHTCLQYSGIPASQIILGFNSYNAKELYESWYPPGQRRLEVINWPFVLTNTSYFYNRTLEAKIMMDDFIASKNTLREHHFLFKIRRPRQYRQALLYKLHTDDLLKLGDWSWLSDQRYNDYEVENMSNYYQFNLNKEKVKDLYNQFPHFLKDEAHYGSYDVISSWTDTQVESYKKTYFYICTETHTHTEYKSITEKVAKPLANFLPFVFVSFKGALQLLREMGFKTFSPYIDESYDSEPDEGKRVNMIYREIEKICRMSKEELHKWYWQMEDIYIHNYNHLTTLYQTDNRAKDMVKYLHHRVNS